MTARVHHVAVSEQKIVTGRVFVAPVGTEPGDPGWTEIGTSTEGITLGTAKVISQETREDGVYVTAEVPGELEHVLLDEGAHFSLGDHESPPAMDFNVPPGHRAVQSGESGTVEFEMVPTYHAQKLVRELMRGVRKEPERYVPNRADRRRAARNRKKDR